MATDGTTTTTPAPQVSTPAAPPAAQTPPPSVMLGQSAASLPPATPIATPEGQQAPPDFLPDFSAFETTRDLTDSAKAGQVAPTLPGSTPSAPPATTAAPAPTTTTPAAPAVPAAVPVVPSPATPSTGLDKDGKPLPLDIKLDDSPLFKVPGTPSAPTTTTPTSSSDAHTPEMENGRDMAGFTEPERKLLRTMSNDSFAFFSKEYRETKQLKSQLEQTRQETKLLQDQVKQTTQQAVDPVAAISPLGFALTPEYAQIVQQKNNYAIEAGHWEKQLGELLAGRKPKQLLYGNGQYQEGQELPADARTQAWIQNNLIKANQLVTQSDQHEFGYRQQYQQRVTADIQAIKAAEDTYFPWFKEGNPTATAFKPVIEGIVKQLPPSQRSNVFAPWLGKSYALIQHLQRRVAELEGRPVASATTPQSPVGATTVIPATSNGHGAGGGNEVTMDAYEAVLKQ